MTWASSAAEALRKSSNTELEQQGRVDVVTRAQLSSHRTWTASFPMQRKDHRFYEIVEDTLHPDFRFGYLLIRSRAGEAIGIQPFFILDQDILAGLPRRLMNTIARIRRFWPTFLKLRTLMIGCAAGEGHLPGRNDAQRDAVAQILSRFAVETARHLGARLIVLKEFPAHYRATMSPFRRNGFTRIPSFPNVRLPIDYADFDDYYRRRLSRNTRAKLRQKFRDAATHAPVTMELVSNIASVIDGVYPLYLQVYEKSPLKFELLTKEFILALGTRMPDKVRFFVWKQEGRTIGFAICMVDGDTFYLEYMGMDYAIALDVHLYFIIMRDVISWAISQRLQFCYGTGLNYAPKYHLRFELDPLDIYVRFTSAVANFLFKPFVRFLEPTRHDATLKRFSNYRDLY